MEKHTLLRTEPTILNSKSLNYSSKNDQINVKEWSGCDNRTCDPAEMWSISIAQFGSLYLKWS